ncbi:activin receptor type-2B-like isoform X2 [Dysidea avara]|uniref:activin receptor type-2B-like isoform X2 n=1 Tax=Dysidea avara TaxID=196820 RepID=UPI00332B6767
MPTILFLCSILLVSMITVTNSASCLSNDVVDCPDINNGVPFCVVNCSQVAIEQYNQPASHGNCQLLFELGGIRRQACFIDECPFTECIPVVREDVSAIECCCTEDFCNLNFTAPSTSPTPSPPPVVDLVHLYFDEFPHHTNDTERLVCEYLNCSIDGIEGCISGYEVCSEDPGLPDSQANDHSDHFCLVTLNQSSVTGELIPNLKRCFVGAQHSDCGRNRCLAEPFGHDAAIHSCCCTTSLCNANVEVLPAPTVSTSAPTMSSATPGATPGTSSDDSSPVAIIYGVVAGVVLVIIIALFVVVALFYCRYRLKAQLDYSLQPPLIHSPASTFSSDGLDNVELVKQVGRGRFATVWKASMNNATVAVKSFSVFSIESWNHERDIYTTPLFQHDCLLQFLGADQKTVGYETEYWLVTAYHEYGCLLDFLRVRTINLENLCVMAESIAMGLAHLHSSFTRNGVYKPAIVHRDFKSKNVLVKEDLSCVISDFGLAFKFVTGESPVEAQGQVGTTRYMSPEVLEGAVNFQREAFMRIDMYACGLVLWELTTRCSVNGSTPGDYVLPFEDLVKGNPSIEMMKQVVVTAKKRPEFSAAFNVETQLETLITTITECWDDDAEARLSAKTVEERIKNLRRDINKPPVIDNEKEAGLMVSLTPSQSMPVIPGNKELSSGISSIPNSYSTLTSPNSNGSPTFSPRMPADQETSSPLPLTSNSYVNMNGYPMANGHVNSNGSSNKNHKTVAVQKNLPNTLPGRANGRLHSYSETTL